jgi:hypothetical protein
MPEDVNDHVAMEFHGLVLDLQRGDVERFEADQKKQAELRAALRRADSTNGLNAGELLKKMDGDPETANRRMQGDLDRIEREAKAAADKQKVTRAALPEGHFPPPPENE